MFQQRYHLLSRHVATELVYAVLFNTAIAVLLSLLIEGSQFLHTLMVSQCIGLTMFSAFWLLSFVIRQTVWWIVISLLVGAIAGVTNAMLVSLLWNDTSLVSMELLRINGYRWIFVNLFLALFFGSIVLYFFMSRERHHQAARTIREVQIKNLDHEKQIAETQLQLLQAQIEPHFLFNSLSNVISLIESEPDKARLMLESLTRYLRSSLSRSQDRQGCLQDELDLIENYFKILQIRMGERLQYSINVDKTLLSCPFPIMLLQPLVENAIKHGLEPLAEGGRVELSITRAEDQLKITVSDNGVGLKEGDLKGFGLMNVRKRLQSLYGDAAQLEIQDNSPRGVIIRIEMPYE
ncbi:MAG: histidine kinase [Gammaproteobacteria bacterium]|nr:histidine kinase [Gammaproteobacteria bacterium]